MQLFDKTNIKSMSMKNRFFKAASWEALATDTGHMTSELFQVYEELAKGGVGTILTGYAFVTKDEQPNPGMMGIYEDSFIEEYKQLTEMVHQYDSTIVMQLVYGGSMSTMNPPSKRIMGPSAIENERTGITPIAMTKEDMKLLVNAYGQAALRAKKAGFDGVQIHAAHGYMLSQFLCPHYNHRNDEYGGCIENRARILLDIVQCIRTMVGEEYPIMIKLNSEDYMEDGLTSEESIKVGKLLEKAGIDAIEVSGGNESSLAVLNHNLGPARTKVVVGKERESYFAQHATRLAEEVSIPVILTGGNRHYDVMEQLLASTKIAFFGLCRPLICEPGLIHEWENGEKRKPKCVSCNGCYHTKGKRCVFNIEK